MSFIFIGWRYCDVVNLLLLLCWCWRYGRKMVLAPVTALIAMTIIGNKVGSEIFWWGLHFTPHGTRLVLPVAVICCWRRYCPSIFVVGVVIISLLLLPYCCCRIIFVVVIRAPAVAFPYHWALCRHDSCHSTVSVMVLVQR